MRNHFLFLVAILAAGFSINARQSRADDVPVPVPATQPVQPDVAQPQPPVAYYYGPRQTSVSVMILPFKMASKTDQGAWISQAMEEGLRAHVARNPAVGMVLSPSTSPDNRTDAIEAGLRAGSTYVVYGTYQLADDQVTVDGSILSPVDGREVAPLSASGNVRDLFAMEDTLYAQLQNLLPAPPPEVAEENQPQTVNNYYFSGASAPEEEYPVPEYDYGTPGLGYLAVGPYLYGGYPGFYGGFGYYGGGFNRGGFNRGGFNRGGFGGLRGNLGLRGGSFGGGGIRINSGFRGGFGGGIRAGGFAGGVRGGGRR